MDLKMVWYAARRARPSCSPWDVHLIQSSFIHHMGVQWGSDKCCLYAVRRNKGRDHRIQETRRSIIAKTKEGEPGGRVSECKSLLPLMLPLTKRFVLTGCSASSMLSAFVCSWLFVCSCAQPQMHHCLLMMDKKHCSMGYLPNFLLFWGWWACRQREGNCSIEIIYFGYCKGKHFTDFETFRMSC